MFTCFIRAVHEIIIISREMLLQTFEQRMIATARHMIWKLKAWYGAVYSYIHLVPGFVTEKMAESKKYTEELFNTLSKVRNIALLKCSSKLSRVYLKRLWQQITDCATFRMQLQIICVSYGILGVLLQRLYVICSTFIFGLLFGVGA